MTSDLEAVWSVYSKMFGGVKLGSFDMGKVMGEYRIFGNRVPGVADEKAQLGGMMKLRPDMKMPYIPKNSASETVIRR